MKVDTGDLVGISRTELLEALQESLDLQRHYAALLNAHDGGRRHEFNSVREWVDRLRELKDVINKGTPP
jgi:hypothetical protein